MSVGRGPGRQLKLRRSREAWWAEPRIQEIRQKQKGRGPGLERQVWDSETGKKIFSGRGSD